MRHGFSPLPIAEKLAYVQLEPGDTKKLILTYVIPGPGNYTLQIISPQSRRIGKVEF